MRLRKNLCKDGSYYCVFANITPDYDDKGVLKGYYSVRRHPSRKAIETLTPIYAEMLALEKTVPARQQIARSRYSIESWTSWA